MQVGKNFYFHHIPKTGGSSVVYNLQDSGLLPKKDYDANTMAVLHQAYINYLPNHYSFTIVRNPFDRLVSAYYWVMRSIFYDDVFKNEVREAFPMYEVPFEVWFDILFNGRDVYWDDIEVVKVFPQYIKNKRSDLVYREAFNNLSDWKNSRYFRLHTRPMFPTFELRDPANDENNRPPSIDNIDKILRFETLDQDWKKIADRIDAKPILRKKRVRDPRIPRKDYKTYYTPEMRDRMFEVYKDDFEQFDYDW
jgi:hypothetical protein